MEMKMSWKTRQAMLLTCPLPPPRRTASVCVCVCGCRWLIWLQWQQIPRSTWWETLRERQKKRGGKREDGEKCTLSWAHQKQWLNAGGGGWRELKWLHLKQRMWCNATCMTKKTQAESEIIKRDLHGCLSAPESFHLCYYQWKHDYRVDINF